MIDNECQQKLSPKLICGLFTHLAIDGRLFSLFFLFILVILSGKLLLHPLHHLKLVVVRFPLGTKRCFLRWKHKKTPKPKQCKLQESSTSFRRTEGISE